MIKASLQNYIENLDDGDVIFYKALTAVGELESVDDIVSFKINNKQENITVGDYFIAVIDDVSVTVSEVV